MKVGFYGTPSARQQVYLNFLIEAGHEVIKLEPNDKFDGLSFDSIFVDEYQEIVKHEPLIVAVEEYSWYCPQRVTNKTNLYDRWQRTESKLIGVQFK